MRPQAELVQRPGRLLIPSLGRTRYHLFHVVLDTQTDSDTVGGDYTGVDSRRSLGSTREARHEMREERPSAFQSV